jgi:predicted DNA-binding protein with PD1-like motif
MVIQNWKTEASRVAYRRFGRDESLNEGLEAFARSEGIREATIASCIGSLSQLRLRNICAYEDGVPEVQRTVIDDTLELVSAEGYVQPLPDGGIRVHIHVVAARPSGEIVGGHCEDATTLTGAFMYLQVLEEQAGS